MTSGQSARSEAPYEQASATLLSMQPAVPKAPKEQNAAGWDRLRSHLESRLMALRNWRNSWWDQNWANLSVFLLPRRSIWLTQSAGGIPTPNSMTRGKEINTAIVDPTGTFAVRIASGGLMSGLASPSRPWFKLLPASRKQSIDAAARQWLDDVEEKMYEILAGSNFYNSFAQECEDLLVFGTAPVLIYEDERDLIRLYNPAMGEYYLSSGATMRVDGLYRLFVMTVAEIVDFFTIENCPEDVRKLWQQKGSALEQERIIAHSIEPNFAVHDAPDSQIRGNFTWREVYWLFASGSDKPLSMRGFVDQPFTASRWATQSNDAYGRSPGMDVLPDVIQLQVETRRKAEALEKLVRPPLVADMELKNQPSSILPGHVTYVANLGANSGMRPIYQVNPDINHITQDLMQIQQRIKVGLFNDLFLMLEQAPNSKMTAYEVAQKIQEKLQVLGPVIEGMMSDALKPKLKRIFSILKRKGMIPPAPDSLKGQPIEIEFVSMLALAQKAAATGGIERIMAFVGNLAAVFPQARDKVNVDEAIDIMNDLLGNPQKILFDKDQVEASRAQQAKQMKQQQDAEMAAQGAQTASVGADAANTLSNTQIGGGADALSVLMGGSGG